MDIFQEMQMLAMVGTSTVLDSRKELRELVDFWRNQPWQQEQIELFGQLRNLSPRILNESECFMITDDFPYDAVPEDLRHDSLGICKNNRIMYSGRFMIPVKDTKGNIMGFTGYDKFEDPKYLDSKNFGYKAKHTTFLGMEKLKDYYKENYLFVVEGSMCMFWLRQEGFNAVSSLGSYLNSYAVMIFKRFGDRVVFIPDADEAGTKYEKQIKRELIRARVIRPIKANDVDDSRKLDSGAVKEELLAYIKNPFFKRQYFR